MGDNIERQGQIRSGFELMAKLLRGIFSYREGIIAMVLTASSSAAGLILALGIYEWMLRQHCGEALEGRYLKGSLGI